MKTLLPLALLIACATPSAVGKPAQAAASEKPVDQAALVAAIVQKHGETSRLRAARGVRQVVAFWRPHDGDMKAFVEENFVDDPAPLLKRFSVAFEQIDGHLLEIGRALQSWSALELGPQMPVDDTFAGFDVG